MCGESGVPSFPAFVPDTQYSRACKDTSYLRYGVSRYAQLQRAIIGNTLSCLFQAAADNLEARYYLGTYSRTCLDFASRTRTGLLSLLLPVFSHLTSVQFGSYY